MTAPTALVTGSPERVADVSAAMTRAGYEVVSVDDRSKLKETLGGLGPRSVDCYVQLPAIIEVEGDTVVDRVHNFLLEGLLFRFETASAVLPALHDDATVVLVAGNEPSSSLGPDDHHARLSLLQVLAHCLLADMASSRLRVTVLDRGRTAEEIADIAAHHGEEFPRTVADYASYEPNLSYDDWRLEVLQMAEHEQP